MGNDPAEIVPFDDEITPIPFSEDCLQLLEFKATNDDNTLLNVKELRLMPTSSRERIAHCLRRALDLSTVVPILKADACRHPQPTTSYRLFDDPSAGTSTLVVGHNHHQNNKGEVISVDMPIDIIANTPETPSISPSKLKKEVVCSPKPTPRRPAVTTKQKISSTSSSTTNNYIKSNLLLPRHQTKTVKKENTNQRRRVLFDPKTQDRKSVV